MKDKLLIFTYDYVIDLTEPATGHIHFLCNPEISIDVPCMKPSMIEPCAETGLREILGNIIMTGGIIPEPIELSRNDCRQPATITVDVEDSYAYRTSVSGQARENFLRAKIGALAKDNESAQKLLTMMVEYAKWYMQNH
jgi:hypothetical protein